MLKALAVWGIQNWTNMFYFFLILLCLCSCESPPSKSPPTEKEVPHPFGGPSYNWQRINSRDDGDPTARFPLYYVKVPTDWVRVDPATNESNVDTKKPLTEFFIEEGNNKIRISIHNFPSNELDERIPPIAQVNRWKGQFQSINRLQTNVQSITRNGFVGLFLECDGLQQNQPTMLLGWAMQLAPEYYRILSFDNSLFSRQERADYTIKAVGSPEMIKKHKASILFFVSSFQLIDELPEPQP